MAPPLTVAAATAGVVTATLGRDLKGMLGP